MSNGKIFGFGPTGYEDKASFNQRMGNPNAFDHATKPKSAREMKQDKVSMADHYGNQGGLPKVGGGIGGSQGATKGKGSHGGDGYKRDQEGRFA